MITTTSYGTWNNQVEPCSLSLDSTVESAIGNDYEADVVEAVARAYRAAINEALPPSVSLCGDEFYGPAYLSDCDFAGYPVVDGDPEDLDIKAIVDSVDFWGLVEDVTEEMDA